MSEDAGALEETVDQLERGAANIAPQDAERMLMAVLSPLLRNDRYDVAYVGGDRDVGFDFLARRAATEELEETSIGIEQKHSRSGRPVSVAAVRELLGSALVRGIDRVMLVANTSFTREARDAAARELPVVVELVDPSILRDWIRRGSRQRDVGRSSVESLIKEVSRHFAQIIARDPSQLDHLEWRDMERMIAEIFGGLGFAATLTPGSKDGGKDVILECRADGPTKTYIIEIKHWRSAARVGSKAVTEFLEVVARERRDGGLFLSTYGYCDSAFSALSEIERKRVRFGAKTKVVGLCKTYTKAQSGIWSPPTSLVDLLYEGTE